MVIVLAKERDFKVSKMYAHAYVYRTHSALSFGNSPWI